MAVPRNSQYDLFYEQWLKMSKNEYNNVYLFTWNPKPRFYNYDKYGDNDYTMQWRTIMLKLISIKRISQCYALVPEISDAGKLHIHGFFVMNDKVKYLKSFLPMLKRAAPKGTMIVKANTREWKAYMYDIKDIDTTVHMINEDIIVLTPNTNDIIRERVIKHKMHVKATELQRSKDVMAMMFGDQERYVFED